MSATEGNVWVACVSKSPLIGGILFGLLMASIDVLVIAPLFDDGWLDSALWSVVIVSLTVWTGWRLRRHGGGKMWVLGVIMGFVVVSIVAGTYLAADVLYG